MSPKLIVVLSHRCAYAALMGLTGDSLEELEESVIRRGVERLERW